MNTDANPASAVQAARRNVPAQAGEMCLNVPSTAQGDGTESAQMCRNVPESAASVVQHAGRGTNPLRMRPLSYAQHAAVRLLLDGMGSIAIARELGLNRHTIARWKREPRFAAELERLRATATEYAIFRNATRATAAPAPRPTPSREGRTAVEDARECESILQRILTRRRG